PTRSPRRVAPARRKMTLLDAILLVASAAVGMGAFQYAVRTWFPGWIWTWARGLPARQDLTTWLVIVTCCDFVVFLVPLIAPWTVLLLLLTLTSPRPRLRRAFRRPGVAACAAALVGWVWSGLGLTLALDVQELARPRRAINPDEWAQKFLSDEVFMYVGA